MSYLALLATLINFKEATGNFVFAEQMHIPRVLAHINLRWKGKSEMKCTIHIVFTQISSTELKNITYACHSTTKKVTLS